MANLTLSRRALRDIKSIEAYSTDKWGEKVAAEYLRSIEDALNLLRENPGLLKAKPEVSDSFCFYRVREHFLVCASYEESIFVLTAKHGVMDLPARLTELEPALVREADLLYQAFLKNRSG